MKEGERGQFFLKLRVRVKDNNSSTVHYMVSFIDFYFHFPANFQTKSSPHMFSIFSHVAHALSLGYLWFELV